MIHIEDIALGRIPPHSLESEQSVLGSMIKDKEAIYAAVEWLHPDDFYKEANKEIFEAILSLFNRNEPVDIITLAEELKKRGTLENVGGVSYLTDLSGGIATTSNIKYYCEIVKEKSTLRRLIKTCDEIITKSYEYDQDVNSIIEEAEKGIFDITQGRNRESFHPIKKVLLDSFAK